MRPGITTWNPLVGLALWSGLAPVPLMEVFWGMGLSRSVIAGARLGVFALLGSGPKSLEEMARGLACDPMGLAPLLDALTGFGYLCRSRKKPHRYSLSRQSRRWLLPESKGSLHEGLLMLGDLFASVEPFEEKIRQGGVTNFHHRGLGDEVWGHYIRGLGHFARYMGGVVATAIPVDRPPRRILDVAGGHGLYSVALCRRFPGCEAVVLDLPNAVPHGRALVEEEGFSERVNFQEGDLRTMPWGEGFDVVLLFNILHNLTEPECTQAISRARQAVRVGGTLVIVDSEHTDGPLSATTGFNELFFFLVSGSSVWPEKSIRQWMKEAGFHRISRKGNLILPSLLVLTGEAR
jgi:ubiquinone/menaquinone biosynthesis C-methylase UbiE